MNQSEDCGVTQNFIPVLRHHHDDEQAVSGYNLYRG